MTPQQLVQRALSAYGERVALIDGERRLSFAELRVRSARLANVVLGLGVGPRRPLALLLPNSLEYMEADVAAMRAGVVRVGINPRLAAEEWGYILRDSGAAILIADAGLLEELDPGDLEDLEAVLVVGGTAAPGGKRALPYEEALGEASAELAAPEALPEDPSYILYTSGTTGRPKGATHTNGGRIAATVNMVAAELRLSRDSAMGHVGPLTHGSGSKLLPVLAAGGANVALARFDVEEFAAAVERDGITNTFMVPTMIRRLCESSQPTRAKLAKLRGVSFGGAPISVAGFEQAIETLGPIFTQVYGSCEAPHPITRLAPDDYLGSEDRTRVLESAGRAVWSTDLRIEGEGGDGDEGMTGELLVRAPHQMSGYWNNQQATVKAIDTEGWYRTGDIVSLADDGLITFRDRERDLIISGGYNVYPAEIERVLSEHEAIAEAAVVGFPSEEWGESVLAYVVTEPEAELSAAEATDWVRSRLAGYKKPRRVEFVRELPHGPSGKVDKKQLKDALWQGQERRVN
ncbi:MAG TPA: AMP-binding protein [Solirubrobacterales bacterium]|jgi:acyl-CoA synthetase (AMP-forming)/AMP-acid ligase II|nr:AMP-binding protein [Solirubrobacterales bacterium]